MPQYIRMDKTTGALDPATLRAEAPIGCDQNNEVKGWRWLEVAASALNAWQSHGAFPASVPTNSTTVSRAVVSASLATWKTLRKEEIRAEQWRRMAAVYPLGQVIYYTLVAIRITFKKANGGTLTAGETSTINSIGSAFANTMEPIGLAGDNACAAIDAAATHAAVEAAFAAVAWP